MYRIVKFNDVYVVQKRCFLIFWSNCYIYQSDYSRRLAVYNSEKEAQSYFKLKNCLES